MVLAYDPTYASPNIGWTTQLNHAASGGTGPANSGVVAGELGWTSSTVNGVQQSAVPGPPGPFSTTYADPSESGAVSIAYQNVLLAGDVSPAAGANQGLYKPLEEAPYSPLDLPRPSQKAAVTGGRTQTTKNAKA